MIGNPGAGESLVLENAVTTGLLSTFAKIDGYDYYQLSTSINPGNSGGPVLNSAGDVIAVVTLKASQEGIAFGIPANELAIAISVAQHMNNDERQLVNEQHLARSVFRKLGFAGWINLSIMDYFSQSMNDSIEAGGSAEDGLALGKIKLMEQINKIDAYLLKVFDYTQTESGRTDVRLIQNSKYLDSDTKKSFRELWTRVRQVKSYVNIPRGSYNSYNRKSQELRDEFDSLVDLIQILLDTTLDFPEFD